MALLAVADVGHTQGPEADADSPVRYRREAPKPKAEADLLDTTFAARKREASEDEAGAGAGPSGDGERPDRIRRAAVDEALSDQQIEMLERLIRATDPDDPEYPDYLFRLADQHLQKKAYYSTQVGALYEAIHAAEEAGKDELAAELRERQGRFEAEVRKASQSALKVYEALVDNPKLAGYGRMDEALYFYAFELGELGQDKPMQAAYQRLINDHPNSPHVASAYLSFADYYYGKGQIGDAVRLYEHVIQIPGSPVHAYALYKLAWCHLNPIGQLDPRYDKSLDAFVQTIEATKAGRAGSDAAAKQLRRDARRDLVRAYVHASKPSKAWDFFRKVGDGPGKDEQDARKMMELLANQYFGDGQYTESTFIYDKLQAEFPADAARCEWQGKIVINTLATDNKDIQWRASAALVERYEQLAAGDHDKAVVQRCRDNTRATLRQMATVWHDEAEKTREPGTYALARSAYEAYLSAFPSHPDSYELQYFYAELLWSLAVNELEAKGDRSRHARGLAYFGEAHREFVKTLEFDPTGKHTKDAAYAQMLALKNHLEYDESATPTKACATDSSGACGDRGGHEYLPSDYSDDEQRMLDAYAIYQKHVRAPSDPELPKIMYHRARLMMDHNRFDEAQPLLTRIVQDFDPVEDARVYAAWSATMLVDLLTIRWLEAGEDPAASLAASDALEAQLSALEGAKLWTHPEAAQLRAAAPGLRAGLGWRRGVDLRRSGVAYLEGEPGGDPQGFEKCAEAFIEVFNTYEDHDRADTLLWNAAECSDAAYRVGQSIQIRTELLERFPESAHARDTLHHLAESYQAVAYYDQSARRYEDFASTYAKDERAADALQNAYLFRLGLGQEEAAKRDLGSYESLYKKKDIDKAARIFWSQHDLLESAGARRKHALDYLDTYGTKGGVDRAVVAEAVIGQIDWRRSCDEPLLYDSCISIKRTRRLPGVEAAQAREALRKRQADVENNRFTPPKRCGSPTQGVITVHRRSRKGSAAAQARFARILATVAKSKAKALEIPADEVERNEAFKRAWAMAMVYQADADYERYLRIEMPDELDFVVDDWRRDSGVRAWEKKYAEQVEKAADSGARVTRFFDDKMALGHELQDRYAEVLATGSPYWTLAAAARTASVLQNFADQLFRAEVPQNLRTQDQVWAYCDKLGDYAMPVQDQALAAYEYCVARSTEFQFFNEFSRLCEEEMQQRDAERYPATHELFGASIYTASRIDAVEVLEDHRGGRANPVTREAGRLGSPR